MTFRPNVVTDDIRFNSTNITDTNYKTLTLSDGTFVLAYVVDGALFVRPVSANGQQALGDEQQLTTDNFISGGDFDIIAVEDGKFVVAYQADDGTTASTNVQSFEFNGGVVSETTDIDLSLSPTDGVYAFPELSGTTLADMKVHAFEQETDGSQRLVTFEDLTSATPTEINTPNDRPTATDVESATLTDGRTAVIFEVGTAPTTAVRIQLVGDTGTQNITVDSLGANEVSQATIAALADGGFAIAFREAVNGTTPRIFTQTFNADGTPESNLTQVTENAGNEYRNPQLLALSDGGYLLIHEQDFATAFDRAEVQRYDADGNKVGSILPAAADRNLDEPTATLLDNGIVALTFKQGGALFTRLLVTEREDVIGDEFDNVFVGTGTPESFVGGEGFDTVDYSGGTSGIGFGGRSSGDALGDTFDSIEKIIGTDFDDTFTRRYDLAEIDARGGNDDVRYDDRRSIDQVTTVNLGDGDDRMIMHVSSDDNQAVFNQSSFFGGAGSDELFINGSGTMDFSGTTFAGFERLDHNGNVESFDFTFTAEQFDDFTFVDTSRRGDLIHRIKMEDLTSLDLLNLATNGSNGSLIDFQILGDDDAEFIKGTSRSDEILGGAGDDELRGFIGADSVYGGEGDDEVHGGDGADSLFGGLGNDLMFGGAADDTLNGDEGNDTLFGSFGVDTMFGGDGDDILDGGFQVDHLFGGAGSDTFIVKGQDFIDAIDGGADTDALDASALSFTNLQSLVVNLQDETYFAAGGLEGVQSIVNVENVIGTAFDDEITGNALENNLDGGLGADTVDGAEGDDNVLGNGGGDTLFGGAGNDFVSGGGGDDFAVGGGGNDTVVGNDGADTLVGGGGNDRLFGGAGDDVIRGSVGADSMAGGSGVDLLSYSSDSAGVTVNLNTNTATGGEATGDNFVGFEGVAGGSGNDVLIGNGGDNRIVGNGGDDTMLGNGGVDRISGYGGNDFLRGDDGDDRLFGGAGNDLIRGGAGADLMSGGAGDMDVVSYASDTAGVSINLNTGSASGGEATGDTILFFEGVIGGSGDDVLIGSAADNGLFGGNGNDILLGGAGDDDMAGGNGNDTMRGGAGADTMDGNGGVDTLLYTNDTTGVTVDINANTASGGDATGDVISGFENVTGGSGNDVMTGNGDSNEIRGGSGNDILDGGAGDDTILGSAGDDTINGGDGADVLTGGGGADIFIFVDGDAGTDVITDFDIGVDVIQFLDAASGDTAFQQVGDDTVISYGTGGTLTLEDTLVDDFIDNATFEFL